MGIFLVTLSSTTILLYFILLYFITISEAFFKKNERQKGSTWEGGVEGGKHSQDGGIEGRISPLHGLRMDHPCLLTSRSWPSTLGHQPQSGASCLRTAFIAIFPLSHAASLPHGVTYDRAHNWPHLRFYSVSVFTGLSRVLTVRQQLPGGQSPHQSLSRSVGNWLSFAQGQVSSRGLGLLPHIPKRELPVNHFLFLLP